MKNFPKTLYIWLCVSFIGVGVSIGAYMWAVYTIQDKNEQALALEREYQESLSRFYDSTQERRLLERTIEERALLDSLFISPDTITRFFEILESGALESGIVLEVISARTEDNENITVQFQAQGNQESVYAFMEYVEMMPLVFSITSLVLEDRTGGESDEDQWSARITVELNVL